MSSILILVGKVAGTAAVGAAAVLGVATHAPGDSGSTTSGTSPKVRCARYAHAPAALKADLKALHKLPAGTKRRAAAKTIRKDALHGKYGQKVKLAAQRREIRRLRLLAVAPDALKAELKSAAAKPAGEERRAAVQQVWKDAIAGKYGDKVAKKAEKAVKHRALCKAQRAQHKSKSPTRPSPSASTES